MYYLRGGTNYIISIRHWLMAAGAQDVGDGRDAAAAADGEHHDVRADA